MKYSVIGLMSGTSLDGVDLIHALFYRQNNAWKYEIKSAKTYSYSDEWKQKLRTAHQLNALAFVNLHNEYGEYLGNLINLFTSSYLQEIDFVASHGHTIFHQPEKKVTFQLGNGASIAATCNKTTICDFRTLDVALGGQGAPLVPIGDDLLFSKYDFCINLGGFANVSYKKNSKRIAYDICAVNSVANHFANFFEMEYDKDGEIGKRGKVNEKLLNELNNLAFYKEVKPKSLGREWVENQFLPIFDTYTLKIEDKLRTFYEHIAIKISDSIFVNAKNDVKILVTGGGAYNKFLIAKISEISKKELTLPNELVIDFKEALIFGFLGVLRLEKEKNCLKSVTGAKYDNFGGIIYQL